MALPLQPGPRAGLPDSGSRAMKQHGSQGAGGWQSSRSGPLSQGGWDSQARPSAVRVGKGSPGHPDFRYKTSKDELRLRGGGKPLWVDSQLAARGAGVEGLAAGSGVLVERLSRRPEEGELVDAVGELDRLVKQGCVISESLFYRVLKRCVAEKAFVLGRRVHDLSLRCGYEGNAFLANHIIGMYAAHGKLEEAQRVFATVAVPNAYMWSSIILAYARHGQPAEAIGLYRRMRESTVQADDHIFVAVLKACAGASDLAAGKEVHGDVVESGTRVGVFVGNALVDMYAKCGSLEGACRVFEGMTARDVVTWTALITGYAQQGMWQEALDLYARMQVDGMTPGNHYTFACLLRACAGAGALHQGKQLHAQIERRGLESDLVVGNCLVDMYAKCGSLEDARRVFDRLPTRDVVTWTSMVAGYAQNGLAQEALDLYASMQQQGVTPANQVTFVCLLQACASVGAVHQGKQLHAQIEERGLGDDLLVGNGLVDMYVKCGRLEDARRVFERLPTRDAVTWSALLNGYAEHGDAQSAMECFEEMCEQGFEPTETIFICLLVACSHAGLVSEGQEYFRMMVEEHGIVPTDYHFNCMVDLLGRSGCLDEAEAFLHTKPFDDHSVAWRSLLSACNSYGDAERASRCFQHLVELEPDNATAYVLMGTIYANAGRYEDLDRVENLRKAAGAWKKSARACIEVKNKVHQFCVGEKRCDFPAMLSNLDVSVMEEGGSVPQTGLLLKALSDQEKEDVLCGHAEILALAYGLLNTPDGTPLLITKNLRMCNDCHSNSKTLSRLEKREIIIRDAHQVHHFLDGSCSCRDHH